VWTAELCKLLGEYEQQREKYPALESFMPRIVAFFEDYASKLPQNP
jgi:acetone carboxylase gamma subunit